MPSRLIAKRALQAERLTRVANSPFFASRFLLYFSALSRFPIGRGAYSVRCASSVLLALVLSCVCGCFNNPQFGWPKFFHPGPAPVQQQNAQKFDPYAEYGPALGESRPPRGAGDQPVPEAARDRWTEWGEPRYGYP